ncbi:MAG TPA: glycerol-3-phosphate acyltransferase [Actinomycetota bacterium]|nr:glycerol-3-phosphate acyltransferase [Actinomycetota bacterium]
MDWDAIAWVAGGYLAGTLPSTYLVARARRASAVVTGSRRDASEGDAHILMTKHLGGRWSALAATMDVGKGFAFPLVARSLGGLRPEWVALVAVAVVVGHGWPPYARAMAGRGLSTAAGVLLGLLPVAMVIAGVVILVGVVLRYTGPASTIGLLSAALVAALRGQPSAYVAMVGAVVVVIMIRRLEGVTAVVRRGRSWPSALYHRAVWDTDGPAPAPGRGERAPSPGRP